MTSSIPDSIFNMSALQIIDFGENKLSGTLPSDLGRGIPILEEFYCAQILCFNLSGFISASISNSAKLRQFDLSQNSFTGPIPKSLGNLKYLEFLNLWGNNFVSDSTLSFLASLTNCRNPLDGVLPPSVGNFSNSLQSFEADGYKLKGVIPKEVSNLTGVTRMSLSYNELTGHIPNTGHGMSILQELI